MNILLIIMGFLLLICIFYIFKLSRKISEIDKRGGGNNSGQNVNSSDSLNDFEDRILNNLETVNENIIDLNSKIIVLNKGYSTLENSVDKYKDPNTTDGSIYDTFRSVNAEELGYEVDDSGDIIFNKPVIFKRETTFEHASFFNQPVAFNKTVRINDRSADALRVDGEISVGPDDNFRACIKIDNARSGMPRSIVFGRFGTAYHGYNIQDSNNNTGILNIIAQHNAINISTLTYHASRYYLHNYIWIKDDKVEIKRKLEIRDKDKNNVVGEWLNNGSVKALNVTAIKNVDAYEWIFAKRFQIQNSKSYWNNWDLQLGQGEIKMNIGSHNQNCVNEKAYVKIGDQQLMTDNKELVLYKNIHDCKNRAYVKIGW